MCRLFEDFICYEKPANITLNWLQDKVDKYVYGDNTPHESMVLKSKTFFNYFDDYLALSQFSESRRKHFRVLYRALQRYGLYRNFEVTFDSLNPALIADFERFLRKEHTFFDENRIPIEKYKPIFDEFPECRTPKQRGDNYVKGLLVILRTFIIWANKTKKTQNNPFKERQIKECVYGTPYLHHG